MEHLLRTLHATPEKGKVKKKKPTPKESPSVRVLLVLLLVLLAHFVIILVVIRQILAMPLEDIPGIIPALPHKALEPVPIDTLARHVRAHTEVVPRPVRPVEAVGREVGMAHHRGAHCLEAVC